MSRSSDKYYINYPEFKCVLLTLSEEGNEAANKKGKTYEFTRRMLTEIFTPPA